MFIANILTNDTNGNPFYFVNIQFVYRPLQPCAFVVFWRDHKGFHGIYVKSYVTWPYVISHPFRWNIDPWLRCLSISTDINRKTVLVWVHVSDFAASDLSACCRPTYWRRGKWRSTVLHAEICLCDRWLEWSGIFFLVRRALLTSCCVIQR